ncbi:MAG: hypothetical protein PG981_001409 [Wolbachia endosymbiont of Ctenocephalides orientis wCori]|nr:MAG: hypothetical protein PG981_001409 [Wolbachia endosymbiont of Ctenocephalides orientis wCori]
MKLEIQDLEDLNFDLKLTGFELEKIQRFLDDIDGKNEEKEDFSDLGENSEKKLAVTKPGDLWILGDHKIYCGDSQVVDSFKVVLGGKMADITVCDPPFTQTEFAKEIGASKQYVCYLVKQGIVELKNGLVDREQANEALEVTRDPSQLLRRKGAENYGNGKSRKNTSDLSTMLLKTRIKNEVERGKLLEAKAKAEIGELVSVEEVKREAFNTARVARNNLLNIPDRVSELFGPITDAKKIHELLTKEIKTALESLSIEGC